MFLQTKSQKKVNEDAIGASDSMWIVCDGASSLSKIQHLDTDSDAAWLARSFVSGLLEREHDDRPLEELLEDVIRILSAQYPTVEALDQPSAALAVLRIDRSRGLAEALVLGDCEILIRTESKTIDLTDPAIGAFDQRALTEMERLQTIEGGSFLSHRPQVNSILMENRLCKNTEDGYWIADLSCKWKGYALTWSAPADSIQAAALFSDGFAQLGEFEHLSAALFLDAILDDPGRCLERLDLYQKNDPGCEKLHRLKQQDDTSLVVLDFR